jgi:tRNA threonylcarbamoyladenosine biosynthesis protein TsaE
MNSLIFQARSEAETERLGKALASALPDAAVMALVGTLGAGKTRLVQAVARGSGVTTQDVASPTFVLIHEYQGRRPIFHFDAYRLRDQAEFLDLGPEEYFDAGGLTFIEWADRVEAYLPQDYILIRIEITGPTSRLFEIRCPSGKHDAVVEEVGKLVSGERP